MQNKPITLDELFGDVVIPDSQASQAATAASMPSRLSIPGPVKKLNYSHEAMVDIIIANPGMRQDDIAAKFGYSASWISQIISSDAFQSRLMERKDEIVDPALRATVKEQLEGVIFRSIEIIKQKLSKPAEDIPDNLALRSLELATRANGYGADTKPKDSAVNVHVHLEAMAGNLTQLLRRGKDAAQQPAIEGIFSESQD